jgi:4-diphosphocytidyl-2-C-methyl-D-erythritol kinase
VFEAFTLNAHAKINLILNVQGQRPDGYHTVATVLHPLTLADTLTFSPTPQAGIIFSCTDPNVTPNPNDNLVVRAYHLFCQSVSADALPCGVAIHLDKHIPTQAGLGGGSSDAATTLLGLNQLCHNPLSPAQLSQMGSQLGSDVAFFLQRPLGTALGTRKGDVIHPLTPSPLPQWLLETPVLLVKPTNTGVSTPAAYQWLRQANTYHARDIQAHLNGIAGASGLADLTHWVFNDFEPVVQSHVPAIATIFKVAQALPQVVPLLCGSGATVALFCPTERVISTQQAFTGHNVETLATQLQPTQV